MLFYPVTYHLPAAPSSVIRVIKPNRRAACIDRSTAKRPEHTGDKVSPRGARATPPPGGLARRRLRPDFHVSSCYVKCVIVVDVQGLGKEITAHTKKPLGEIFWYDAFEYTSIRPTVRF